MTALMKMTIWNIHFALVMVLIECCHFQNETLVNGIQDMDQKILNRAVLIRFVGNPYVYLAPESNCFIAAVAIGVYEALFYV